VAVHQSLPVPDVTGLIEYARKNPGKLAYATPGIGSSHHICGPGLLAGLTLRKECLVLFLRNADGGPLFDSFVHLLGGEQRPDRHASEPRGICTQLGGGCGDFIGVLDNRVGGGRAVIEIPKFELASDRLDKLGDTYLEGRGRLLFEIFQTFGGQVRPNQVPVKGRPCLLANGFASRQNKSQKEQSDRVPSFHDTLPLTRRTPASGG